MLEEFKLPYKIYKIKSRTGETQTNEYLKMNPKGKVPLFRYDNFIITESAAAMNFIANNLTAGTCEIQLSLNITLY